MITILGILAGVVVFAVQGIGDKGKASSKAADAAILRTAEEAYCAKFGSYADVTGADGKSLVENKLLTGPSKYNSVATGSGGQCGSGPKSSFAVFSSTTDFLPGDNADGQPFSAIPVGNAPTDVAVNPTTNMVYVLNIGTHDPGAQPSVSVIDGSTDTVVGSPITVGDEDRFNLGRIAVNPHDNKIYVTNTGSNTVSVIDAGNGNTVDTIPFTLTSGGAADEPSKILADPKTDDVYVSGDGGGIMVIDGSNHPSWIAPDFAPSTDIGAGFVLNTTTDTIYAVGGLPSGPLPTLAAIDGATQALTTATLPVQSISSGIIAVNPVTNKVYTTGYALGGRNDIESVYWTMVTDGSHIDNTTVTRKETAGTPAWDAGAVVNPNTNKVFFFGDSPTAATPTQIGPYDGATDAYSNLLFAPATNGNLRTAVPEKEFAINPNTNRVYFIPHFVAGDPTATGGVQVLDGSTLQSTTLAAGRGFAAMAINPVTNKIYATDQTGDTFAVLR